jgi:YegS/Rv2252/BmrU family lipid kinase
MLHAVLVYNPAAGRFPSWMLTERAASLLRAHGWQIRMEQTHESEDIVRLAKEAVAQGMDAFFVVGGDGSINHAISALVDTPTALGVLPAGTANVWAQELGLPGLTWTRWMALEESARRLADAQVRKVDIGLCNERPFLLWAGVGLDAFIVHRLEPRTRWEKHFAVVQYTASAIWNASEWHGMNLSVEADGEQISGHFLLGVVNNIHLYAGGFAQLSPDARLDDGVMDFWLFKGETLGDTVQRVWDLIAGHHQESDQAIRIPFHQLRLKSDSPMYVQVDGEPVAVQSEVHIQVRPQSLRVLAPADTPHTLFGASS